jgi:hypothetical protein
MIRAVIVSALVSGCFADDTQTLTATWHLTSITGDAAACPAGFGSAEVVTDADGQFTTCKAGSLTSTYGEGLVTDAYVEITSDDHATPFARSPSEVENGGYFLDGDLSMDSEILVDGGYFQFSWQLARANQFQGDCGDDGITDIAIETRLVDDAVGTEAHFPCSDVYGRAALAPGRYLVTITARDAQNQIVGTPHELGEQLILDPSKLSPINDLQQITIAIP